MLFGSATCPEPSYSDHINLSSRPLFLKPFSDCPGNNLWLLSGFPVEGVLDKIAAAIPCVGIVAENGCSIKMREAKGDTPDVDRRGKGRVSNDVRHGPPIPL